MHAASYRQHTPRRVVNRLTIRLLLCLAGVLSWLPAGATAPRFPRPRAQRSPLPRGAGEEKKPSPARLTPAQATARAVNHWQATPDGFILRHPHHLATFTSEGVHVTARRGGLEWHWQLTYVGTTAHPLEAVQVAPCPLAQEEAQGAVRYERGRGIVKRYEAHVSTVEQQFVLQHPLPLQGTDLVIRGQVQSAGAFAATDNGWEWRQGKGMVSLGTVKVTDAAGKEVAATMEVTAASTEIVVSGAALAQAVYPVTIDPEIGANDFLISNLGLHGNANFDAFDPAVAYNSTNNEYLVVWSGDTNTGTLGDNEFEIFGQRINATTGAEVGTNDFRISDMGPDGSTFFFAAFPAVAYNSVNNEYLVVWYGDDNTGTLVINEEEIFGQRLNAATGAEVGTNDFRISDMGPDGNTSFAAFTPAVAYNATNKEFLVVWYGDDNTGALVDGEYEIFGQRLTGTAASLFASVLPSSRSVQVGNIASAFATLINASSAATAGCGFSPIPSLPALFHFQHTNCANNLPLGTQDAPIAIDALSAGCFVFLLQPTNTITPTDVGFTFSCFDALAAPTFVGLDTLLLSASTSPTPDIVALGATLCNNGIVNIPTPMGTGVFSVATVNLGSSADITVTADTGGVSLPLTPFVCETNPTTAQCISAIGLSVTTMIAAGATPTFSFFVQGAGNVPFDPAFNRIFVRFKQGPVVRGSTNVAVRTHTENCTVQ